MHRLNYLWVQQGVASDRRPKRKDAHTFTEDVEEQTHEKQHLQRHLHKVLKDLSKAQDYISKLEDKVSMCMAYFVVYKGLCCFYPFFLNFSSVG